METILQAEKTVNGDKWWLREFDINESLERCQNYRRETKKQQTLMGLELFRVRNNIKNKVWGAFLLRLGIEQPTVSRRWEITRKFLNFYGIADIKEYQRPNDQEIGEGLEILTAKSCNLHDFFDSLKEEVRRNMGSVRRRKSSVSEIVANRMRREADKMADPDAEKGNVLCWGISPQTLSEKIRWIILWEYPFWSPEKRQVARDELSVFESLFHGFREELEEPD